MGLLIKSQIRELSEELGRGEKAQSPRRQAIVLNPPEAEPKLSKTSPSALPFTHLLHAAPTLLAFQKGKLIQDIKLNAFVFQQHFGTCCKVKVLVPWTGENAKHKSGIHRGGKAPSKELSFKFRGERGDRYTEQILVKIPPS